MAGSLIPSPMADTSSLPFRGSACNPRARACRAKGDTCTKIAMRNGYCTRHGGKSLSGAASPRYKGAGQSQLDKALPAYLKETYASYREDWAGLVDLSDMLAVQKSTIEDLYARMPSGESGETWKALRSHQNAYREALSILSGSATGKRREEAEYQRDQALTSIMSLIEEGAEEWRQRKEIGDEIDRLNRVVSTETKRRESASNVMAMHLVKRILHIIQTNVTDPKDQAKIQRELSALFAQGK